MQFGNKDLEDEMVNFGNKYALKRRGRRLW